MSDFAKLKRASGQRLADRVIGNLKSTPTLTVIISDVDYFRVRDSGTHDPK
jgi:hypothetical protein